MRVGFSYALRRFPPIDESKLDSAGLAAKYKIEFVPTFIFFRDGKELGRIVEKPDKRNLEKHVLEIVGKE